MATTINVFEQELFGAVHWRVMHAEGQLIFGRIMTDFPTRDEAVQAIQGEYRRNNLGEVSIVVKRRTTLFAALNVGDRFLFNDLRAGRDSFNRQYGPFTKIDSRRYRTVCGAESPVDSLFYVCAAE